MPDRLNILNKNHSEENIQHHPDDSSKVEPWFSSGLRFKCTGCGQCCTGAPGYVWVTEAETTAMAKQLNLTLAEFRSQYVRRVGDRDSLIENSQTFDCVFLKDKKCQIYSLRPKQCRTFPWWLHNLQNEAQWKEAGQYCEGINHPEAPLVPEETIIEQLIKQLEGS